MSFFNWVLIIMAILAVFGIGGWIVAIIRGTIDHNMQQSSRGCMGNMVGCLVWVIVIIVAIYMIFYY